MALACRLLPHLRVCILHLGRAQQPVQEIQKLALYLKHGGSRPRSSCFPSPEPKWAAGLDLEARLRQHVIEAFWSSVSPDRSPAWSPSPPRCKIRLVARIRDKSRSRSRSKSLDRNRQRKRSRSRSRGKPKAEAVTADCHSRYFGASAAKRGIETGSTPFKKYQFGNSCVHQHGASEASWRKTKWLLRKKEQDPY